ncbi:MAG: hydrolase 1, exosortase system-associated [Massilia sp.]|nr:hydrolase 1, exosortase system-associated [Massilia sp.]
MKLEQRALRFHSAGVGLIGIVDVPERPLMRGMLVLPDSTQYRAGSHRQFTLLSRLLAGRGIAVMRFDRRGFGDSEGEAAEAGTVPAGEDIAAAMKEFFIHVPEMKESVILAPGDAAPLAAQYAAGDARVAGLALLDPLLPEAAGDGLSGATVAPRSAPRSAAERLFRRAAAFRSAAARAQERGAAPVPAQGGPGPAGGAFGGRVLLVSAGSAAGGAGSTCALEHQGPRSRRVQIAGCANSGGSAWREAVAFACASWLTSW